MQLRFDFEPLRGFGPITLGATRDDARAAMSSAGFPLEDSNDSVDYYCDASIQTECGDDGRVQFIGVACSIITLWDADPQYDRHTNESKAVWGQVGMGNAGYIAAIEKIHSQD